MPNSLKPLKPFTESQWQELTGKGKWDCVVALRGPDFGWSESLKYYTASVIRHKLSGIMRVGGMVNSQYPFILVPSSEAHQWHNAQWPGFDLGHFCQHVQEAAGYLGIPIVALSKEAWETLMKSHINDGLPAGIQVEIDKIFAAWAKRKAVPKYTLGDPNE